MIWGQLAWFVVTTLVSIALAPKPPRPRPAALDDLDLPVSEEGKPVPVIFGTVRQTGPNVIWYGDLSKKAIRKKSLFSSAVVGYRYYLGIQFLSGIGPADALTQVEVGEKVAWSGSQTASGNLMIDQPNLFGGKNREGGLKGTLEVRMGEDAQTASAYLESTLGAPQSADRGLLTSVFRSDDGTTGGYIGNSAYPKPWAFTWRRILKGWVNDAPWYSAAAAIGTSMNPAHVIYQTLTDPEWGMGVPASALDDTVFRNAADDFVDEGFGLDLQLTQQVATEDFLQIVLDHVGGLLRFNHATGLIELKLLRGDYDPAELEIFDEARIARVSRYQRQGWGETVNEIVLVYTDPTTRRETSLAVNSLGNISAQGAVVSEKLSFPGISSHDIAAQVALRELRGRSTPLASLEFEIDRSAWAYTPGDVFRFSWSRLGVDEVVFRVVKAVQSELDRNVIVVSAIEDIYGLPAASFTSVPSPGADPGDVPDTPTTDESGASVISTTTTAPPGSPTDGDTYYVPTGATGAWAGHAGELATWDAEAGAWEFSEVGSGSVALDTTSGNYVTLDGAGGTSAPPWMNWGASISPSALGSNTDNWAPTGLDQAGVIRVSASSAVNLTGLTGGASGRTIALHNVGSNTITLKDETTSTEANRFALTADIALAADAVVVLQYDTTSQRWRAVGGGGSSAPITTTLGDLIVHNGANEVRLPVGPDGSVLVADSSATEGVEWQPIVSERLLYATISMPSGNTVASTAAETTFETTYNIPANTLTGGSVLHLRLAGVYGTHSTAPTVRIRVKLGGTTLLDTAAYTTTLSMSNRGWGVEAAIHCHVAGASGVLEAQGVARFSTSAAAGVLLDMENTATSSVDTTTANALEVTVQWGTSNSANTITLRQMSLYLASVQSGAGDPYFSNVVVLAGFDGADGATSFTDESAYLRTFSFFGNAQLDTAESAFGGASLLLDGAGDYVSVPHSTDLSVSSGNFTIEAWVRRASTGTIDMISNKRSGSSGQEHSLHITAANVLRLLMLRGATNVIDISSTTAITDDGLFHHIAATRQGTTCRIFIDGVLEASGTQSDSPSTNTSPLLIGRDGFDSSRDFHGWIDEYRFTKGVARYTASFTPPAAPFPRS